MNQVQLREVADTDLPVFFEQQIDPEANFMAAFTSEDPTDVEAFSGHWNRILEDPRIQIRTIVFDGAIAGYVLSYLENERQEVSYWIGKEFWGQGIATTALGLFLRDVNRHRPIYARVAKDNIGSIRVLERGGFLVIGEERGFANAREREITELIMELEA